MLSPVRPSPFHRDAVLQGAIWNQLLWTAGNLLTTGGFLTYFVVSLNVSPVQLSMYLVIPETVRILGLGTHGIVGIVGNKKQTFLLFSVLARSVSLFIPLVTIPSIRSNVDSPFWMVIGSLAAMQVFQAVAYVAYVGWLAELVPDYRWGRFFGRTYIARVAVLLVIPMFLGTLQRWLKTEASTPFVWWGYTIAFLVGNGLMLASLVPLLRLPAALSDASQTKTQNVADEREMPSWTFSKLIAAVWSDRRCLWLLAHQGCLALANGVTQTAFTKYRIEELHISIAQYYRLEGVMYGLMIPVGYFTGVLSDRYGHRSILFFGTLAASCALPFWLVVTPQTWWLLFAASCCWSGFAAVNIAGPNLLMAFSPPADRTVHLALFIHGAGLLSGVSGFLGGIWLQQLLANGGSWSALGHTWSAFQIVFVVSWIGRILAACLVLMVRESEPPGERNVKTHQRSDGHSG